MITVPISSSFHHSWLFSSFFEKHYLASLGLSCSTWRLPCVMHDFSLRPIDSLVVVWRIQSSWAQ